MNKLLRRKCSFKTNPSKAELRAPPRMFPERLVWWQCVFFFVLKWPRHLTISSYYVWTDHWRRVVFDLLGTKAPVWGGEKEKAIQRSSSNHAVTFWSWINIIYNIQILTVYKGLTYVTVCNILIPAQRRWIWIQSHYIPFHDSRLLSDTNVIRGQNLSSVWNRTINIQYTDRVSLSYLSGNLAKVFTRKSAPKPKKNVCLPIAPSQSSQRREESRRRPRARILPSVRPSVSGSILCQRCVSSTLDSYNNKQRRKTNNDINYYYYNKNNITNK